MSLMELEQKLIFFSSFRMHLKILLALHHVCKKKKICISLETLKKNTRHEKDQQNI